VSFSCKTAHLTGERFFNSSSPPVPDASYEQRTVAAGGALDDHQYS
jgi:hypothetical protein